MRERRGPESTTTRRLVVPVVLAVTILGATVATSCTGHGAPPPTDATPIIAIDAAVDAVDGPIDAPPDAPIDAPIDSPIA